MLKQCLRILLGVLLPMMLMCSCADDYTLDIYGTISGKVTDYSTGEPLQAAQVTLVPGANTIQTNADGAFSFTGLDEGLYTVSVQREGYKPNNKKVKVVSGETVEVAVALQLIRNE